MIKNTVECRVCHHSWTPKVEKPAACPKCKRYDWEVPFSVREPRGEYRT